MKIKVVTINIWQGGELMDGLLVFLKSQDVDILILQEVYNGKNSLWDQRFRSMEVLREELRYQYDAFFPAFFDTNKIGNVDSGNAILSKFPIVATKSIFFGVPYKQFDNEGVTDWRDQPKGMGHALIEIHGQKIHAYSVHGIWGFDGEDNQRRLGMGQAIVNEIKGKEHVVLAGDFNLQPYTKTVVGIEKYLKNVFKNELTSTFNMKRKKNIGYATAVVDMMFVSPGMQVGEHMCPQVDISDHLPLVAELEI